MLSEIRMEQALGRYTSPNRKHVAELLQLGEVRFGPPYCRLRVDGHVLPERIFGLRGLWSPDSRLFATQEWVSRQHPSITSPDATFIFLVDAERRLATRAAAAAAESVPGVSAAYVAPTRFENAELLYTIEVYVSGDCTTSEEKISIADLSGWTEY